MKQVYITYVKEKHQAMLIKEKRIFKIQDNQNEEINKLRFLDELVAIGAFNNLYYNNEETPVNAS